MPLSGLKLTNLGPFREIDFDFDPQVNAFVGPNNSGKTTVLLALANLLIEDLVFPEKLIRGDSRFSVRLGKSKNVTGAFPLPQRPTDLGKEAPGFSAHVPALRLSTDFRSKGPIPPSKPTSRYGDRPALYGTEWDREQERTRAAKRCSWIQDELVIQQIVELDYRAYRENRPSIRHVLGQVAVLVSEITEGFPIEFVGIDEDQRGLFLKFRTLDGEVPLDVLSQGTQSLIQWCAKLLIDYSAFYSYPRSLGDKPGVLLVDEIDAHLHPSWQRRILPALTKQFPSLQVFCAAHSPMTLAGLKAGQVQLLSRDAKGKVVVSRNPLDIDGWSVNEIYTSVLGVEPTDLATTEKVERLRILRRKEEALTASEKRELKALREDLHVRLNNGPNSQESAALAEQLKLAALESNVVRKRTQGKGKKSPRKRSKSLASDRR